MGKGRDKRKKAKGSSVAGQGALKTERKTQKNEEKRNRRGPDDGDENDIDAILAQLNLEEKGGGSVKVTPDAPPPSPRVCGLWLSHGDQTHDEILLFGGEFWDRKSDRVYVYDDIYKYSPAKDRWTKITSRGPQPRSACSGVIHKTHLYVFGGEFTSPNQEKFKHYRDMWRLDLSSWEWDELKTKSGPSARSGHRMALNQGKIYLFGGYYDTGDDLPKYYNDLWCFDASTLKWESIGDMRQKWPPPRSGFQWVCHRDRLIMHGGYTKIKDDDEEGLEHGKALNDTWAWHIADGKWEKLPRAGMAPSARASFAMVPHKNSALMFGGAADREAKGGEVMVSTFFNELYRLDLLSGRWYTVALKPPKGDKADAITARAAEMGAVVSDEEAAQQAAATRIQAHFRGHVVRKAYKLYKIGGALSEVLYSPAAYGLDLSSARAPKPRARINPNACVVKNTLWLLGGVVEIGDREVTLDDIWKLDMAKLDGWVLVKDNTAGKEDFETAEGSVTSDDTDNDGEEDDLANLPKLARPAGKAKH